MVWNSFGTRGMMMSQSELIEFVILSIKEERLRKEIYFFKYLK